MADRVDAHHHFWRYDPQGYAWIDECMSVLKRDCLPEEFARELSSAGWAGSVVVQTRQTTEETDWLLSLATQSTSLWGVVGWAPIADAGFPSLLERLRAQNKLKGLRHVIQDEPDDHFILRPDFNRGIAEMKGSGLVYEILIHERHLPAAIVFVDRHPDQVFVLDHLAKPPIAEGKLDPWRGHIVELARREHVHCKVSGMVTEANWSGWTSAKLRPYFDVVLDAFGPGRLIAGSDWPVCLLATTYARWSQTLNGFVNELSPTEQDCILGTNAIRVYQLHDSQNREDATGESARYQESR